MKDPIIETLSDLVDEVQELIDQSGKHVYGADLQELLDSVVLEEPLSTYAVDPAGGIGTEGPRASKDSETLRILLTRLRALREEWEAILQTRRGDYEYDLRIVVDTLAALDGTADD